MTDLNARIQGWSLSRPVEGGWLGLRVEAGDIQVNVSVSSEQAREMAFAILEAQMPNLKYDPPNPDMTEIQRRR